MTRRTLTRKGVALLAVLVGVAAAALATTSLLVASGSQREARSAAQSMAQVRACAREALSELAARLADQRPGLLAGADAEIETLLVERAFGESTIIVRVAAAPNGATLVTPESARANINVLDADRIALIEGMDAQSAASVAAATPALAPAAAGVPSTLLDALTTLTRDSPVASDGVERLVLEDGWTTTFRDDPPPDWSPEAVAALLAVLPASRSRDDAPDQQTADPQDEPLTLGSIYTLLDGAEIVAPVIREVLDRLTPAGDLAGAGMVDVSRADARVLVCVPGFDADSAQAAIDRRETLDPADLASPIWLVNEGVLDSASFAEAIDTICARSLQWRVVLEAGVRVEAEASNRAPGTGETLAYPMRLEAVVDVADEDASLVWLAFVAMTDPAGEPQADQAEPLEAQRSVEASGNQPDVDGFDLSARAPSPFVESGMQDVNAPPIPSVNPGADPRTPTTDTSAGARAGAASRSRLIGGAG
ncbi:MAG: hypothetical protein AAF995_01590 [Planctomycetota bacterium]